MNAGAACERSDPMRCAAAVCVHQLCELFPQSRHQSLELSDASLELRATARHLHQTAIPLLGAGNGAGCLDKCTHTPVRSRKSFRRRRCRPRTDRPHWANPNRSTRKHVGRTAGQGTRESHGCRRFAFQMKGLEAFQLAVLEAQLRPRKRSSSVA